MIYSDESMVLYRCQIIHFRSVKRNDLTKRIAQVMEELEELRSEKTQILARFDYTEDKDIQQVRAWVRLKEKNIDDCLTVLVQW